MGTRLPFPFSETDEEPRAMFVRPSRLPLNLASALLLTLVAAAPAAGAPNTPLPGEEALEYGFRFASAIEADRKDMGKAQEAVVLDYARAGALDKAIGLADRVEGWRRGTVYADLAAQLAEAGRVEDARTLLSKATTYRSTVEGWQNTRIAAHVAQAYAQLGELDASQGLAVELASADPRQYSGRSIATVATASAVQGDFDRALLHLSQLDDAEDFDVVWWRTTGYLTLAQRSAITAEQRARALEKAHKSALGVPGWKSAEALDAVAAEYAKDGRRDKAREALLAADAVVLDAPDTMIVKAELLSTLARTWGRIGDLEHARELLAKAEQGVPETMLIDQPQNYAAVAAAYLGIGDDDAGWRVYDLALAKAEGLVNARPRALSVVAICRTMGRNGIDPTPAARARLDALFAGLGDPW